MKQIFKNIKQFCFNYQMKIKNVSIIFNIIFLICLLIVIAAFTNEQLTSAKNIECDSITIQNNIVSEQTIHALKYDSLKIELINEVNNYIKKAAPTTKLHANVIVEECINNSIDICFVLAQGEQESHFGTTGLARKTNSVFNVYAFDGRGHNQISSNGKYKHPNYSVKPYIELLKKNYLVNGKTEYNLMHGKFVNKYGQRYASSKTYEKTLLAKYTKIKQSTIIDSLIQEMNIHKLFLEND